MKASKPRNRLYCFGPFRLDVTQRVLFRGQEPVPLTGKAFDTLLVLAQNSRRIVDKEQLLNIVWPDAIVEENNLNQNISTIRKALGEDLHSRSYIETVPRRGYRLVVTATETWEESGVPPQQTLEAIAPGREKDRGGKREPQTELETPIAGAGSQGQRDSSNEEVCAPALGSQLTALKPTQRWLLLAAGLGLLLIGIGRLIPLARDLTRPHSLQAVGQREGIPALTEGKYVAVLPFRVLGDQASLAYVAQGLAEALSARLFGFRSIHVASEAAVERAGKPDSLNSLDKIAHELGSNLLVQGTVEGSWEKMRVVVDLEDVADRRRLWSGEFSGTAKDILALEDQVYSKLVTALNPEPGDLEFGKSAPHPTDNIEAYDLYLRGQEAMRHAHDLKSVEAAIRFHEQALKKDPGFALAYAGLADGSLELYRQKKDSFWAEKALAAARNARRLDDDLAEVHFTLGSVYEATGRADEAVSEEKRGLELAPNSDEGYRRLGNAYLHAGRKQEALRCYEKAVQINPYYWFDFNVLGNAYFQTGDYDKALSAFRRVTELEPDNVYGYENIGAIYTSQGKWSESIRIYQKALQIQPHFVAYSNLGTAYFYLSRYDEAARMFEKAAQMNPNEQVVVGNLADAYRWSGQSQKAAAAYERAIALAYRELEVNPRKASTLQSLALYYAKKGDHTQALELIRRARSIEPSNVQIIYGEAVVEALAGQSTEALNALREALQKGYPPQDVNTDPELKDLRVQPEFQELVRKSQGKSS